MTSLPNKQIFHEIGKDEPDFQKIENMIIENADVNIIDYECFGEGLLGEIAYSCHGNNIENYIKLIELLLKKGADINYQDWGGDSCLHKAIFSQSPIMVKFLLEHGANPNLIQFEDSESVLDFACSEHSYHKLGNEKIETENLDEIIKLIIQHKGKPSDLLFCKNVDTYLLVEAYFPTGLFTLNGNINIEDIPNVDNNIYNELMYWKINAPARKWRFDKKNQNHPLVISYHEKQKMFVEYFSELFKGKILVGANSYELALEIEKYKEMLYKKSFNDKESK